MTEREAERLEKLTEKLEQLQAQKNKILAKDKQRQKKERTRNLIKCGTLSEKYFGLDNADFVMLEKILANLTSTPDFKNYLENLKNSLNQEH